MQRISNENRIILLGSLTEISCKTITIELPTSAQKWLHLVRTYLHAATNAHKTLPTYFVLQLCKKNLNTFNARVIEIMLFSLPYTPTHTHSSSLWSHVVPSIVICELNWSWMKRRRHIKEVIFSAVQHTTILKAIMDLAQTIFLNFCSFL